MIEKQPRTVAMWAIVVGLAVVILIRFVIPIGFWRSSGAIDIYKIVFNALCVAVIGSALVYWNNTVMARRREFFEMQTAERNVQREIHLKRKDQIASAITKLLEMRQLIFYAFTSNQNRDAKFDSLPLVDLKSLSLERQRDHRAHQKHEALFDASVSKLEILRGELIVAAELYGDFPEGVELVPHWLTPYIIEAVVRPIIARVSDTDEEAVQTLDHLILRIIEDLRELVKAEEVLAKRSLNAKVSYIPPVLLALQEVEATTERIPEPKHLNLESIGVRRASR